MKEAPNRPIIAATFALRVTLAFVASAMLAWTLFASSPDLKTAYILIAGAAGSLAAAFAFLFRSVKIGLTILIAEAFLGVCVVIALANAK